MDSWNFNWKQTEYNLETRLLIIEYEKALDNAQRQILFYILQSRNFPDSLLRQ
jgi:hypothetical protein